MRQRATTGTTVCLDLSDVECRLEAYSSCNQKNQERDYDHYHLTNVNYPNIQAIRPQRRELEHRRQLKRVPRQRHGNKELRSDQTEEV